MTIADWKADRAAVNKPLPRYRERHLEACLKDIFDQPIAAATGVATLEGWQEYSKGVAGATSQAALGTLKMFGKWLMAKRLMTTNIADGIAFEGVAKKGKPQIETVRELYAFRDEVWRRAEAGDRGALGVLVGLYLGLRSGEVQRLEARHVDIGRSVVVPGTKTAAAKRTVPVMVPRLWALLDAAAREGGRLVPVGYETLCRRVVAAAKSAGVANAEELCFHSLRGMAASLATKNHAAFSAIAEGLGHTSYEGMTAKHYATPGSRSSRDAAAAISVLDGAAFPSQDDSLGHRERN